MNPTADWIESRESNGSAKYLLPPFDWHFHSIELVIAEVSVKKLCLKFFGSRTISNTPRAQVLDTVTRIDIARIEHSRRLATAFASLGALPK